jgi:hypothetical protein
VRSKLLIAVCALVVGAAGGWFANRAPAPVAPEPPAQASAPVPLARAPMPRPARNERVIPRADIYGAGNHSGMKDFPQWGTVLDDGWDNLRKAIRYSSQHAFLLNAPTLHAASDHAAALIRGEWYSDGLRLDEPLEHNKLWAFVSFGLRSFGTLEMLSFTATDDGLTVNYRRVRQLIISGGTYYAYFVPLGEPKPSWFTIRLFDVDEGHDTRVVRVYVGQRPRPRFVDFAGRIQDLSEYP